MSFIRKIKRGGSVYLAEVENRRIDGKIVQRHIRYIGKAADDQKNLITSLSDVQIESVKVFGPLLVLNHLANEINLREILGQFAPEILSLVYAHCLDYKSVNKMERWFERTDLNVLLGIDRLTEARLLSALDSIEKVDVVAMQRNIFNNIKKRYSIDSRGIIYDVTNTYFHGKQCPLGKYGKDKDGVKGRPLIQIGLGVTRNDGIPVFHQVYNGNVHDSRMFQDAITTFGLYSIKDVLVVFDRGINSKKNQLDLDRLKLQVLCGLPLGDDLKKLLRKVQQKENIVQLKNRVPLNDSVFYIHVAPYSIGGVKGRVAFCVNDRRRFEAKEARYREIAAAQLLLNERKVIKDSVKCYFSDDGHVLTKKVTAAEEFDGCSCIFTTDHRMVKEEMVQKYFDKDLVEKAFHDFKGVIKLRPIRHWLENRVKAHVFICYLSYLLLSLLNTKVSHLDISAVTALEELETLYKVYFKDTQRELRASRVVAVSRKQEDILRAVDKNLLRAWK